MTKLEGPVVVTTAVVVSVPPISAESLLDSDRMDVKARIDASALREESSDLAPEDAITILELNSDTNVVAAAVTEAMLALASETAELAAEATLELASATAALACEGTAEITDDT